MINFRYTPVLICHVILVYNKKHDSSIRSDENTNFDKSETDFGTKDSIIFAKESTVYSR